MVRVQSNVDPSSPSKLVLNAVSVGLGADQFFRLCRDNPDFRLELTAQGKIIVMPPAGAESGRWNFEISSQLSVWSKRDKTGVGFDSSAGFTLPNGAVRSPDVSWIRRSRWNKLQPEQREKFAPICPDFVLELRSPTDDLSDLKLKMQEYIENGAQLGFLIDPVQAIVWVYRHDAKPQRFEKPDTVNGDPCLPGFKLRLAKLWRGTQS